MSARAAVRHGEWTRPWMYPAQSAAVFCPERYAVVEASSKSGKTLACLVWLIERALATGAPNRNFWWLAPIYAQAKIAYRRAKFGLPREAYAANETELTLTLPTGGVLWFKGAEHADSLYGEDVYAAVVDEASRVREESWHAVRSTLTATRGPIRLIGNVKGRRNWFYALARRAEAGEPGLHYARITAHDAVAAGILDAGEIEEARRQLPEAVFQELYLAEPSDDAGNPFGLDAIRACLVPALSDAPPVCWGVDLAKSLDWCVAIALDAAGHVCRLLRWQAPWRATIDRLRDVVGEQTPALVDSTGVGDPVLEALQEGRANFSGQKFTQTSKQQLMEGLAVAIQQGAVRFPDGPLRAELDAFEYSYTRTGVHYEAAPGMHDDCVCALALAVRRAAKADPWDWGRAG